MRINKARFTLILTFLTLFVFNTGVAMEMEPAVKKPKTESASPASSTEFVPEFDVYQPVIIIDNTTKDILNIYVRNNYFEPITKEYFVVDQAYTKDFSLHTIAPSKDTGPAIKLFSNSANFVIIPINQIEDVVSIFAEEPKTKEALQLILAKKLLQNRDRMYTSLFIRFVDDYSEKGEFLLYDIVTQNNQIERNIDDRLLVYRQDDRFRQAYYIAPDSTVEEDLEGNNLPELKENPDKKLIYLISQSQQQKRELQQLEMGRLQQYLEKSKPTLEQILLHQRK